MSILDFQSPALDANGHEYCYGIFRVFRVLEGYQVRKGEVVLSQHRLLLDAMRQARWRNNWQKAMDQ
jgi:hypothetical protein